MAKSIICNLKMVINQIDRINYYNILAMLASAGLAIIIPFELVLLSYAILGPAHYLTEISWLKGRQFFTIKRYDYLIILGIVIAALLFKLPYANLVFYTFGLSFLFLFLHNNNSRLLAAIILVATGYFLLSNNLIRTIFGVYMLTLIHVYFFTGAFLLYGCLKSKSISGYLSLLIFIICPILLCILFTDWHSTPAAWAANNYSLFARLNTITLRNHSASIFSDKTSILLTRIIAFAYTYHYLNWFSKTKIIHWHKISVSRAIFIVLIWAASVGLYFYNYVLGFKWLFILSMIHVILEFPLNHRTFLGIGRELRSRILPVNLK